MQVQPILPWFLRSRLRDQPALDAAASRAHYQHYTKLAQSLQKMLESGNDPERRAVGQAAARAEYANLTAAVEHGLRTGQPTTPLVLALDVYLAQVQQHDVRRQLLTGAIAAYSESASPEQQDELAFLHDLAGLTALQQHRLDDARTHYEAELELEQALGDRRGTTYHQLGRVAQEQRRFAEADAHYHQALDLKLELGERHSAAATYHQLGIVAQEQRRFAEADAHYGQALDIFLEFGDRHNAAATYHQLGIVAQEQRRFAEADAHYRQALNLKLEFGDRYSAAGTDHQLGIVAQAQERFAEADAHYRQALDIFLEFGDRHSAAGTYHQLGIVAQAQERFAEADAHYRQALDIFLEFGDRHSAARAYHQLGMVAQAQERFTEADAHYRQALDIFLEFDRRAACRTALVFGIMLARLDRHQDAIRALLYAAVTWHQQTGHWDTRALSWLHRERALVGPSQFTDLIEAETPATVAEELTTAIDQASSPQDGETGEDHAGVTPDES